MRILILGVSAIALSGCSWLGLGNNQDYRNYNQNTNVGNYNTQKSAPSKSCHSGACLSRWNVEAAFGPTFNVGGNAVSSVNDEAAGIAIDSTNFSRAYKPGIRGELGGSYALRPNRKITGNVFYEQAESDGAFDWGTIGTETLNGGLSDFESYGAEIGLRQYFSPRRGGRILGNYRPYVEGRLGAAHQGDIDIEGATLGGTEVAAGDIPFYESGWVGSAAGLVGVETPVARHTTIAIESGIRYTTQPGSDRSVIVDGSPFAGTNNSGDRFSIPFMIRGRYRF